MIKGEGTSLAAYYKDHVVPSGQANPGRGGKSGNNQQKREITPVDPDVQQKYVKWLYQVIFSQPEDILTCQGS